MSFIRLFQRYAVAVLALGLALLTGCTDQMLTDTPVDEPSADASAATSDSKLRYAHLLGTSSSALDTTAHSKRILQRYEDLSTDTDFILGISSETTLDPQRILQRYEEEDGMTVTRSFDAAYPGFALHIDEEKLDRLLSLVDGDGDISWIEPDPAIQYEASTTTIDYNDGQYLPWGIDMVEADKVMEELVGLLPPLDNAHVFMLDSGIDSPDINVCETRSFLSSESSETESDYDTIGHGTHLAGVVGAMNNAEGVLGMAPNVCLHDYRVVDNQGIAQLSSVVQAVDHITQLKQAHPDWPMVVNISLGADVGSTQYNALDEAIDASIDAGVVYVLAAGNDGIDARTVTPARVTDAITVGAFDDKKERPSFSNYGQVVDIHAPGTAVVSLPSMTRGGEHLAIMDGTSPAAAHVSGAAALYLATKNPSASTAEVATVLSDMSKELSGSLPDETTRQRLHLKDLIGMLDTHLSVY